MGVGVVVGLVTQDKIRPTNSKRQWTDEAERKRMEEWKEAITADWAGSTEIDEKWLSPVSGCCSERKSQLR